MARADLLRAALRVDDGQLVDGDGELERAGLHRDLLALGRPRRRSARALSLRTQTSTPGLRSAAVAGRPGGGFRRGACSCTSLRRGVDLPLGLLHVRRRDLAVPLAAQHRRRAVELGARAPQRLDRFVVRAAPRRLQALLGLRRARLGLGVLALGLDALGLGRRALGGDALALDLEVEQQLLQASPARRRPARVARAQIAVVDAEPPRHADRARGAGHAEVQLVGRQQPLEVEADRRVEEARDRVVGSAFRRS